MHKPRVYWKYYPTLRRGYWRVSPLPKNLEPGDRRLWGLAYDAVNRANLQIVVLRVPPPTGDNYGVLPTIPRPE
jgi:hypothetical protein